MTLTEIPNENMFDSEWDVRGWLSEQGLDADEVDQYDDIRYGYDGENDHWYVNLLWGVPHPDRIPPDNEYVE